MLYYRCVSVSCYESTTQLQHLYMQLCTSIYSVRIPATVHAYQHSTVLTTCLRAKMSAENGRHKVFEKSV